MITPEELQMADKRVDGASEQKIADGMGITKSKVHRHLSKPEVRTYIEEINQDLIQNALDAASENIKYAVKSYKEGAVIKKMSKKGEVFEVADEQLRDHGFKASIRLLESNQILSSNIQSLYIQQIYNDQRTEISHSIKELLAQIVKNDMGGGNLLTEGSVVEAEETE
jgi:predicted DNA binding protein